VSVALRNGIACGSLGAVIIAVNVIGLPAALRAQERPAQIDLPSRKQAAPAAAPAEARALQRPCDKDSEFCPVTSCGAKSVLCIDASNKASADDEDSYRALTDPKNAEQVKILSEDESGKPFAPGDSNFYSFVRVNNHFEDGNVIATCADNKTGRFTIVNIAIDYKGQKGSSVVSFVPLSTLFIHANSVDVGRNASAAGCTFKSASHQIGPYILYSQPTDQQQEYTLHLKTTAGLVPSPTKFAMFAKLATSAAAVWPGFIALSQPASALIGTVAADLDQLSAEAAVTSNIEYSAILTAEKRDRKDAGVQLHVWSPRLGEKRNSGYMEFAQVRSASIVMDANASHDRIGAEDVLSNTGLGASHRCIPGSSSTCDREQSFVKALNAEFDLYGDFTTVSAPRQNDGMGDDGQRPGRGSSGSTRVKSGAENWAAVFQTCERIRTTADELGLTPIDALAVRWALLQRARLIDVLRDYQSGKMTGMEGAIKAASRVGMNDAYKQCWDAALDDKRMHAVEALMNGRKFSPAIP
jgi:hypothetical protein